MSASSWRLALRLAYRDAMRSKGRSLLVVALIGLPVLVLGVVDIGYRTYELDPDETLSRTIGTADVGLRWSGLTNAVQGYDGWLGSSGGEGTTEPAPTTAEVAAALPAGSRVIEWKVAGVPITFTSRSGTAQAAFVGLDLADPLTRGIAAVSSGRAPRDGNEVALTMALSESSGLGVGDALRAAQPARTLRVVGLVADRSEQDAKAVYSVPAATTVDPARIALASGQLGWLARTPGPMLWPRFASLNRRGLIVLSRPVYLHPPGDDLAAPGATASAASYVTPVGLVAGMALLEIVLLAGPAFAVGAKRRRRDLALIAAAGGAPRDLRRVVLGSGVVLGAGAGLLGVLAALGVSAVGRPVLAAQISRRPGHFDVRVTELMLLFAVGVLAALLAAVAPARAAGRDDVVATLAGRRGERPARKAVPVIGVALVGLGTALAVTASAGSSSLNLILGGIALVELGLIACTPMLLGRIARLGRRLPLPPRLALRDAGRNRSAATPAVAAVMAAVIGAVAIMMGVGSQEDRERRQYSPTLPRNVVLASVPVDEFSVQRAELAPAAAATIADRWNADLPLTGVAVVRGNTSTCPPGVAKCTFGQLAYASRPDASFGTDRVADVIVDDGSSVDVLFGVHRPDVAAALRAGRVVAAAPVVVRNGQALVRLERARLDAGLAGSVTGPDMIRTRTIRVPALVVSRGYAPAALIVPPSLAARFDVPTPIRAVVARTTHPLSDAELQRARSRARAVAPTATVIVDPGYRSRFGVLELVLVLAAAAIAVVAAVVATALANVDSRADLVTLGAVGASPRVRRTLSAARAAVIALLGTAIGVLAGPLVPMAWVLQTHRADAAIGGTTSLRVVVPWLPILVLAVTIPLIAGVVAAASTRSRLPSGARG